jgi:hypothetical protein
MRVLLVLLDLRDSAPQGGCASWRRHRLCSRIAWASRRNDRAGFSIASDSGGRIGVPFPPDILESGSLTMNLESSDGAVTVLIVEDEPLILDMISQELTEQGFAVLEAETGEAALSIIESARRSTCCSPTSDCRGNWTAGGSPRQHGKQSLNCR